MIFLGNESINTRFLYFCVSYFDFSGFVSLVTASNQSASSDAQNLQWPKTKVFQIFNIEYSYHAMQNIGIERPLSKIFKICIMYDGENGECLQAIFLLCKVLSGSLPFLVKLIKN